jgi:hypothetical protein
MNQPICRLKRYRRPNVRLSHSKSSAGRRVSQDNYRFNYWSDGSAISILVIHKAQEELTLATANEPAAHGGNDQEAESGRFSTRVERA